MSKQWIITAIFTLLGLGLSAQRSTVDLTFTAVNHGDYVRLDSIMIRNLTHYWYPGSMMLHWPDTAISLEIIEGDLLLYVGYASISILGVDGMSMKEPLFEVYPNRPNPMEDHSDITVFVPATGKVHFAISDLQGRNVLSIDRQLEQGHHHFRFYPGDGNFHLLAASWNGISRSIKMISSGNAGGRSCRLDYIGGHIEGAGLKSSYKTGYLIPAESGIIDQPSGSLSYTFEYATNRPCPGTPVVDYEGQVYNTIEIRGQCWLKENLNVGEMIPGTMEQSDNGTIEKHCYDNEPDNCNIYGGLYSWNEMMQYTTQQGARGICPPGWHLPMDDEWNVLQGAVDSEYGIGYPGWYQESSWGYDVGTNLKSTSGWVGYGNGTNEFGFSALPGGNVYAPNNYFHGAGMYAYFWTSTEDDSNNAWEHDINHWQPVIYRQSLTKSSGFSVRCLRDD